MALLEELKKKYHPVIQAIQAQKVELANMHVQEGKLFMKGRAPSLEAANRVWAEIRRINPKLDDIIADFPVHASRPMERPRR